MKTAICMGINEYPNPANRLDWCVNDARGWMHLLTNQGFNVRLMADEQVTRMNVIKAISDALVYAKPGDWLVFQYSGHGTYTVDWDGDESDGYDEALFLHDGMLTDDEIREILKNSAVSPDVHIVFITDSCYSGTVTRKVRALQKKIGGYDKIRFVPPADLLPKRTGVKKRFLAGDEMIEILLSGCADREYSYESPVLQNGVFTHYATELFKKGMTFEQWHQEYSAAIPSQYPQTPQLEGSAANKALVAFEGEGSPGPEPTPEPEEPEPWYLSWYAIGGFVLLCVAIIAMVRGC